MRSAAHDLVADLEARYGVAEPGLYGVIDDYTPVTNQSLAMLALTAAGVTPPTAAIDWLVAQQCTAPASAAGAWEGYRAPAVPGPGLEACEESLSTNFTSADSNSTAFAVQALVAVGSDGPVADALGWLDGMQDATAGAAGRRLRPAPRRHLRPELHGGRDPGHRRRRRRAPPARRWTIGGGTPLSSLESWIVPCGDEAGALASPYSGGFADTFATYQGVWGLAEAAFPLPVPSRPSRPPRRLPRRRPPTGGGRGRLGHPDLHRLTESGDRPVEAGRSTTSGRRGCLVSSHDGIHADGEGEQRQGSATPAGAAAGAAASSSWRPGPGGPGGSAATAVASRPTWPASWRRRTGSATTT